MFESLTTSATGFAASAPENVSALLPHPLNVVQTRPYSDTAAWYSFVNFLSFFFSIATNFSTTLLIGYKFWYVNQESEGDLKDEYLMLINVQVSPSSCQSRSKTLSCIKYFVSYVRVRGCLFNASGLFSALLLYFNN